MSTTKDTDATSMDTTSSLKQIDRGIHPKTFPNQRKPRKKVSVLVFLVEAKEIYS